MSWLLYRASFSTVSDSKTEEDISSYLSHVQLSPLLTYAGKDSHTKLHVDEVERCVARQRQRAVEAAAAAAAATAHQIATTQHAANAHQVAVNAQQAYRRYQQQQQLLQVDPISTMMANPHQQQTSSVSFLRATASSTSTSYLHAAEAASAAVTAATAATAAAVALSGNDLLTLFGSAAKASKDFKSHRQAPAAPPAVNPRTWPVALAEVIAASTCIEGVLDLLDVTHPAASKWSTDNGGLKPVLSPRGVPWGTAWGPWLVNKWCARLQPDPLLALHGILTNLLQCEGAEIFAYPVDLRAIADYGKVVKYPIDLGKHTQEGNT